MILKSLTTPNFIIGVVIGTILGLIFVYGLIKNKKEKERQFNNVIYHLQNRELSPEELKRKNSNNKNDK